MIVKNYTCKCCGKTFTFIDCYFIYFDSCVCKHCNKDLSTTEFFNILREIENEQKEKSL